MLLRHDGLPTARDSCSFRAWSGELQLTIADASGGHWAPIAQNVHQSPHAWSPDGQWVAFLRTEGGKQKLFKIKPVAGATPVFLEKAAPVAAPHATYRMIQWSPAGDGIAYQSAEGMSLISPDGNAVRKLTARSLPAFAFSKDGALVYGIVRNITGNGAQWQLYSIDVKTGAEKMLALPGSACIRQRNLGLQPSPGRQALSHVHREVAVRYLDARRLGSAGAKNLAGPLVATMMRCGFFFPLTDSAAPAVAHDALISGIETLLV